MLGLMEQVVTSEVLGIEEVNEQGLPPGFRFHPTDEELITFYLASKVYNGTFCGVDIAEVDLNRCEPWELPDVAKMGEREWYFFSLRDRKYPTGLRTNRATGAGYWKATGKDREVCSAATGALLGMKKTLVFYKGRAPRGQKTKWVMHEYRLDGHFSSYRHTCKDEWVICRIHDKSGDRRNPQHVEGQGQESNFDQHGAEAEAAASKTGSMECHAESTTLHHQQSSWSASSSSSASALESMLFKSLLFSYQDHHQDGHSINYRSGNSTNYTTTTTTACKNEEALDLSHFQTPPLNVNYFNYLMGKNHSHPNGPNLDLDHHHRNSSVLSDGHFRYYNDLLGLSTSTSTNCAVDNETMTSSIGGGFNKAGGFQTMLLDPLVKPPASEY